MSTVTMKDSAQIFDTMLSSKLVRHAELKVYKGLPHGMASTHHDVINADLRTFFKS